MDTNYNQYSPEQELAELPREYPLQTALANNDIVFTTNQSYNVDRLLQFIDNIQNGHPDKVILTSFGIDGPAVTNVLQYDGNIIRYTSDPSRVNPNVDYITFYGHQIFSQIIQKYGRFYEEYYLLLTDNSTFPIYRYYF